MKAELQPARGRCEQLDPDLVAAARSAAASDARIVVHQRDIMEAGPALREAHVVTLYLSTRGNEAVLPLLRSSLRPGARVVSNVWEMPGAVQRRAKTVSDPVPIHLYVAPL